MILTLVDSSNLNWIDSHLMPNLQKEGNKWESKELILLFDDGYICRGKYILEEGWYGYNTNMELEYFISNPKYYIEL